MKGKTMKTCTLCRITKPESEFHFDKECKGGRVARCRVCVNIYRRANRKKKLDAYRAYETEYYSKITKPGRQLMRTLIAQGLVGGLSTS